MNTFPPYASTDRYPVSGETLNTIRELVTLLREGNLLDNSYRSATADALENAVSAAVAAPLADVAEALVSVLDDMEMAPDVELAPAHGTPALWLAILEPLVPQLRTTEWERLSPNVLADLDAETLDLTPDEDLDLLDRVRRYRKGRESFLRNQAEMSEDERMMLQGGIAALTGGPEDRDLDGSSMEDRALNALAESLGLRSRREADQLCQLLDMSEKGDR